MRKVAADAKRRTVDAAGAAYAERHESMRLMRLMRKHERAQKADDAERYPPDADGNAADAAPREADTERHAADSADAGDAEARANDPEAIAEVELDHRDATDLSADAMAARRSARKTNVGLSSAKGLAGPRVCVNDCQTMEFLAPYAPFAANWDDQTPKSDQSQRIDRAPSGVTPESRKIVHA